MSENIREERIAISQQIMEDIQSQVRGEVWIDEETWIERYILKIETSEFMFCYDITDMVYDIQYEQSIIPINEKKAVDLIIREYKTHIYNKYFKEY